MNSIFPAFPAFPALPALQKDHWQHGLREQESESARERESESVRSRARRACESSEVDPWDYLAGVTVFEHLSRLQKLWISEVPLEDMLCIEALTALHELPLDVADYAHGSRAFTVLSRSLPCPQQLQVL